MSATTANRETSAAPTAPGGCVPLAPIESAVGAQTRMLASMLGAAGIDLDQLMIAARLAGLVRPSMTSSPAGLDGPALEPVGGRSAHRQRRTPVTVRDFYEDTVAPIARSASGAQARGGGMFRTYEPYWKLMVYGYPYQRSGSLTRAGDRVGADPVPPNERLYEGIGDVLVHEVRYRDLDHVVGWCKIRAELAGHRAELSRERRGRHVRHTDQTGAERNAIGALRFFFKHAVLDDLISADRNVAGLLRKPPKRPSSRRALTATEYAQLWDVIVTGGNDPQLDSLLAETVLITGARREGLLNLNLSHLDDIRVTITLDEKNGRIDEQPATAELIQKLRTFARGRGSVVGTDPVFCYLDSLQRGRPHRLTSRRFDYFHSRVQETLPWADRMGFSIHVLRHHAITTVERITSEAVAARFARHTRRSVTSDYDKASGEEVCAAVAAMTGTVHPLADGGW